MTRLIAAALAATLTLGSPLAASAQNHHLVSLTGLEAAQIEAMSMAEISLAIFAQRAQGH